MVDLGSLEIDFPTAPVERGVRKFASLMEEMDKRMRRTVEEAQRLQKLVDAAFNFGGLGGRMVREFAQSEAALRRYDSRVEQFTRRATQQFRQMSLEAEKSARATSASFRREIDGRAFDGLLSKAKSTFASIRSSASGLFGGLSGGGSGGGLLGSALGFAGGNLISGAITTSLSAVAGGLKSVVSAGFDFNETVESAQIGLKRLLGSSQAANDEIERIKKAALTSPANFDTLLELDQRLRNVGFTAKTLAQDIGNFSQGVGLLTGTKGLGERVERIVNQLAQMATKGRAANEELATLAENNIPVYKLLGNAFGATEKEVFRLAESGQLKGLETAQLLMLQLAKAAREAGPEIQKTYSVLKSNADDLFQQASGRATENLFGSAKRGLEALTGPGAARLSQSVAGQINAATGPLTRGFDGLLDSFQTGKFFDVGAQIVSGIGSGIEQKASEAWEKAKGMAGGVLDTVKRVLEIESPSKKMRALGEFAGDGFVEGLIDRTSEGFKRWAAQIEKIGGDEFLRAVERLAQKIKADPNDLLGVFAFESGLNPQRRNRIGATGLIQALPSTAQAFGTTTDQLRTQTAVTQLAFVEKYLTQFGRVLDSTEKLYTAVLRGKVIGDPDKVLFTKGTKAYAQNAALDRDGSGTITAAEGAYQIRKQGFTTPTATRRPADEQLEAALLKQGQFGDRLARAGTASELERALATRGQFSTRRDADAVLEAALVKQGQFGGPATQASLTRTEKAMAAVTAETQRAAQATDDLDDRIKALAASARQNPFAEEIEKVQKQIAQVGQYLPEKAQLAQLNAIRDLKKADEDAYLSMIENRVRLADATVYHAGRADARVLDYLARETKGITEITSDAKVNVIQQAFSGVDALIGKATERLGAFGSVLRNILSDLAKLALSKVLQRALGLSPTGSNGGGALAFSGASGGGGFQLPGLNFGGGSGGGGFSIPGINGGGGSGGGFSLGGINLGGAKNLLSKIPGVGGIFGPRAVSGAAGALSTISPSQAFGGGLGLTLSNDTALAKAAIAAGAKPAGAAGGLLSGLGGLGASGVLAGGGILGSFAGGSSQTGRLLGGLGGTLLAGAAGSAGLLGGGISAALPALLSNPFTIAIGGALIGGALLFNYLGNREFNKFRKVVQGEYQLKVRSDKAAKDLYLQEKALGEETFGKGKFGKKIVDTIRLDKGKQLLAAYGEATGQENNALVRKYRDIRELTDVNDPRNQLIKRALGGPVNAGRPYIVGDGGRPEVFMPHTSGQIFPSMRDFAREMMAHQMTMMQPASAPAAATNGRDEQINKMMMGVLLRVAQSLDNFETQPEGVITTRGLRTHPEPAAEAVHTSMSRTSPAGVAIKNEVYKGR